MHNWILATAAIAAAVGAAQAQDDPDAVAYRPYIVKTFTLADGGNLPDLRLVDATVSLIGEPNSKSFGLSYRGTLIPDVAMTGDETLVLYLYIDCDDEVPSKTSGINVGIVELGTLKEGRETATLIVTADASAFVPLSDLECAKLALK